MLGASFAMRRGLTPRPPLLTLTLRLTGFQAGAFRRGGGHRPGVRFAPKPQYARNQRSCARSNI